MNINQLFENDDKPSKSFIWTIVIVFALLILSVLHSINYDINKLSRLFNSQSAKNWANIFIGFLTSILATLFYEYYIKAKNEKSKLKELKNIAGEELTTEVLSTLEGFKRRFLSNYNINCKISKHTHPDFFQISVTYSFEKILTSTDLQFQFSRITSETDRNKIKSRYDNAAFLDFEFFDAIDETDFSSKTVISDADYTISNPIVSFSPEQGFPIQLSRLVDNNDIIYTGDIPNERFRNGKLAKFQFTVKFPLEKDSFHDFTFDLPLHTLNCVIDYGEVKDDIFISGTYYISSKQGPTIVERGDDSQFTFLYNSWLMPKSSLLFIWWKKQKNA